MLLNHIPAGPALSKPTGLSTRCTKSAEEFKAEIIAGLLPAQLDFVQDDTTLILGLCAGFGAGKTRALCAKACIAALDNPGTVMAVFEPTHILLRDVWCRSFDDFLEEFDIEHDFRVSPQPEYRIHTSNGSTTLLCRATETWNRIRGQNLSAIFVDEIDTSPLDVSQKAVEMFLARLRGGDNPQLAMASTPEGYRIMHKTFIEDGDNPDRRLIKAKTTDNPFLPAGFVESLYQNYDANLVASYVNGEFTLLTSVRVYHPFDRDLHWTDDQIKDDERIFVGLDLNVGACFLHVIVRRGDEFHVVHEAYPKDTPAVVKYLQDTFPKQWKDSNIVLLPDASSRQRSTTNASESDLSLLKKGGFEVKAKSSNPQIEDRINCINVLLLANRLKVHSCCKYLTKSLEIQSFTKTGKPEKGIGGKEDVSGPVDALGYAISYLAPLRRYQAGGSTIRVW